MGKSNIKFKINPNFEDELKDAVYEQFKDTDIEIECPNCGKSIVARIGEHTCEYCGATFPVVIEAKL